MATDRKLVPFGMVIDEFEKMPDGLHQFEKAFPGITGPQGYKKYIKVDAQSGAWMLEVPKEIQDEISVHNVVEGAKISNTMAAGDNGQPVGPGGPQSAAMVSARMSKGDMQKTLQGGAPGQPGGGQAPSPFMASVLPTKIGGK